ncbi:hypothetical protein J2D73_17315 [Acetobacter sacchari]|uniref:Uncharacterized protein n=1 Tax=Acetobacter sacchari TaxID=2661687 RepID=A0ABS3M052_9PROT|nr:hypothetical protein [Acetobacter sacchari]MBO1361547.1 hypothetical protein [Acetobacter sacchari]
MTFKPDASAWISVIELQPSGDVVGEANTSSFARNFARELRVTARRISAVELNNICGLYASRGVHVTMWTPGLAPCPLDGWALPCQKLTERIGQPPERRP